MEVRRLKQLRSERHLSQKDFARAMKVSPSTVGMWEQGRNEPSHEMLNLMANYFGVTTDYLLGRNSVCTSLTKIQRVLLEGFNALNNEGQNTLMNVLGSLKVSHSKQKESNRIIQANTGNGNILTVGDNNTYGLTT